jgi:hypothetical protein
MLFFHLDYTRLGRLTKVEVNVPIIGGHGVVGSWVAAFRWQNHARELVQEGYEKVDCRPTPGRDPMCCSTLTHHLAWRLCVPGRDS